MIEIISICLAGAVSATVLGIHETSLYRRIRDWHAAQMNALGGSGNPQKIIWSSRMSDATILGTIAICIVGLILRFYLLLPAAILVVLFPLGIKKRFAQKKLSMIDAQMDNMLANLANAVSVTGNLYNAIEDVADGEAEPMRSELQFTLHEIRLGTTEEDAFLQFGERSGLPLLRTAIAAVVVGKQSGGNLGEILSSTAKGIREIKRLEGVLKVKTSEARNQAWVMGMVPFFLCGILQILNPQWLQPLWSTPLGWAIVGLCITLEIIAVVLIRKIMTVTL